MLLQLQPLTPLVDEFASRLFGELDYVQEGLSAEKFQVGCKVPFPLTRAHLLVGIILSSLPSLARSMLSGFFGVLSSLPSLARSMFFEFFGVLSSLPSLARSMFSGFFGVFTKSSDCINALGVGAHTKEPSMTK